MDRKLNSRQLAILNFIRKMVEERGYPPSVREIGEAVGLKSSSTVHAHLVTLQQKGYIKRNPATPRAIALTGSNTPVVRVPVLGKVTAGEPVLAVENVDDVFPLPAGLVKEPENTFILRVHGDSMRDAGILDGDYVVVRRQQTAADGDIVVALLGEEATVKRFYKEAEGVRLQPENPCYQPVVTREVQILGKVVGLLRKLD